MTNGPVFDVGYTRALMQGATCWLVFGMVLGWVGVLVAEETSTSEQGTG